MVKKILLITTFFLPILAQANNLNESSWSSSIENSYISCGIYSDKNTNNKGKILTSGESVSDGKSITLSIVYNAPKISWKITEANIINNKENFKFSDDLLTINSKKDTSVFINDNEYNWEESTQNHDLKVKELKIAPKINMDSQSLPLGQTTIQGKIVITCSN